VAPPKTAAPLKITVTKRDPTPNDPGYTDQLVEGMPVVGPMFNKAVAASRAALDPVVDAIKGQSFDDTFGQRYEQELKAITGDNRKFAAEHPVGSTVANLIGGGMLLGPLSKVPGINRLLGAGGHTVGERILVGGAGGGALAGGDAYLRGDDPKEGAVLGLAGGVAGPVVSAGLRGGTRWFADNVLPRTGALRGYSNATIDKLVAAAQGETPASLADAKTRMGPAGFVADINPAFTDLAGGVADVPGPGKQVVRGAYAERAKGQRSRVDTAVTKVMGPAANIETFKNYLTETRKAAADPLYKQWRTMKVHPTDAIKALIPRLEESGAFKLAEQSAKITGEPINMKFFTGGDKKDFPTTQTWDYVKRGLDRAIDQAYKNGDKSHARDLINLKHEMVDEIGKTDAGQVWRQARQEFAERSALLDQVDAGRDTFLGGRSGLSADELREELRGLKGPELAARVIGARSAVDEAMGASLRGDTQMRDKLLAPNNVKKLELLVGKKNAAKLVETMEQERYLAAQHNNVSGNSQTTPKKERVNALLPQAAGHWDPDLTKPLTLLPPRWVDELRPSTWLDRKRAAKAGSVIEQLAPLLVTPASSPEYQTLLRALRREGVRRGRNAAGADRLGGSVAALVAGETPVLRRRSEAPAAP
jgi:hypothetical protein